MIRYSILAPLLAAALTLSPIAMGQDRISAATLPESIPADVDLAGSFSVFFSVRMKGAPDDLPTILANKDWESGEMKDYTTNNSYGLGRESGSLAGFAVSVLPDGAWTWNAGDGRRRIDHRPEAADQSIADGRWHEVGFSVDRGMGVVHLFHDGRRVALHDLQGVSNMDSGVLQLRVASRDGIEIQNVRMTPSVLRPHDVASSFAASHGADRAPPAAPVWDGAPLKVLAWNIWHGGRRKGRDEGVARVTEVIRNSGADIVLMQETYGSGPRIAGRLGFEFYLRSSNLSIMSRYPIGDVHRLYQGFRFGGATIWLRPDLPVQAYSLWINYLPSVEKALASGATGLELAAADAKTRGKEIHEILNELIPHLKATPDMPVIIGGDFNSGSHLDWTQGAADLDNHQGRVVTWPVSAAMDANGFVDTFRVAHPDPIQGPGFTWSPEFPESHQDRIDYVYTRGEAITTSDSVVLRSHPRGWPSDHAGVLSTLRLLAKKSRLKVMSYNIKHGLGNDGKIDLERVAGLVEKVAPDVLALQEMDENCGRSGSVDQAAWLGKRLGMTPMFGPFMDYNGGRYGMALLSRVPVVSWENIVLPGKTEPRASVAARLRFSSGSEVVVVGVHFYATEDERLAQAREVLEYLKGETAPVLLAGDFNSTPDSPVMELFGAAWLHPEKGEDRLTFPSDKPDREIDYFVLRGFPSAKVVTMDVLEEPVISDHRPLVLDVEWGR